MDNAHFLTTAFEKGWIKPGDKVWANPEAKPLDPNNMMQLVAYAEKLKQSNHHVKLRAVKGMLDMQVSGPHATGKLDVRPSAFPYLPEEFLKSLVPKQKKRNQKGFGTSKRGK